MEWEANHSRVMKSLTNRITIASERLQIHLRDFHNDIQHSQKYTFQFDPSNDTLVEFRPRREPVAHNAGPTQRGCVTIFEFESTPISPSLPNLVPVDAHIGIDHITMTNRMPPRNHPLTGTTVAPQRISEGYGGALGGPMRPKPSDSKEPYGRGGRLWHPMDRSWKAVGRQVGS